MYSHFPETPTDFEIISVLQQCTRHVASWTHATRLSPPKPVIQSTTDIMAQVGPRLGGLINSELVQNALPNLAPPPPLSQCHEAPMLNSQLVQFTLHAIGEELYNHMKLSELLGRYVGFRCPRLPLKCADSPSLLVF